jgi:hypothetical protein
VKKMVSEFVLKIATCQSFNLCRYAEALVQSSDSAVAQFTEVGLYKLHSVYP